MNNPHELAKDISAQTPMGSAAYDLLRNQYRFSPDHLVTHANINRGLLQEVLGELELATALSTTESLKPVAGVHQHTEIPKRISRLSLSSLGLRQPEGMDADDARGFVAEYAKVRDHPLQKLTRDTELATDFLRLLGPTNPLHDARGFDAAFEFGRIRRLLERDFANLPAGDEVHETQQKPEKRFVEALLAEELALLWKPSQLAKAQALAASNPRFATNAMVANPRDKNVHPKGSVGDQPEKVLWRKVGIRQSEEAAELFEAIHESMTAPLSIRAAAGTRMVDMRIRALQLQYGLAGRSEKATLKAEMMRLNDAHRDFLVEAWGELITRNGSTPENRAADLGSLFEQLSVVKVRDQYFKAGAFDHFVRQAMPREDEIHKEVPGLISPNHQKVNLSADIISEDIEGRLIRAFQVKATSSKQYKAIMRARLHNKGEVLYPRERIDMVFGDTPGFEVPASRLKS